MTNAVTPTALRFAPPINVSDGEIDEAVAMITAVLAPISAASAGTPTGERVVASLPRRHRPDRPTSWRWCSTSPSARSSCSADRRPAAAAALIFEKPSNRTRQSIEIAVVQLGGHPVYTRGEEVGFDVRETVEDVTRIMSGYHAVLAARVFDHRTIERMAAVAEVPVVNLLSDRAPSAAGGGRRADDDRDRRPAERADRCLDR